MDDINTLHLMNEACGLTLPAHKDELSRLGFGFEAVSDEISYGFTLGVTYHLADIA
jgi:hypothetical protein